jgi:hypothetical protein
MSRGPGHVERAVEAALHDADRSFTVEELAQFAYGIVAVEKKHRVAVLRTLGKVEKRLPLWFWWTHLPPWRRIVSNRHSVRSYAHGLLRVGSFSGEHTLDRIETILADPDIQAAIAPGGLWWTEVELNKFDVECGVRWKAAEAAGLMLPRGGLPLDRMSPEHRELSDQRDDLTNYYRTINGGKLWRQGGWNHALLGKFEPPGSPVFEYAMQLRDAPPPPPARIDIPPTAGMGHAALIAALAGLKTAADAPVEDWIKSG